MSENYAATDDFVNGVLKQNKLSITTDQLKSIPGLFDKVAMASLGSPKDVQNLISTAFADPVSFVQQDLAKNIKDSFYTDWRSPTTQGAISPTVEAQKQFLSSNNVSPSAIENIVSASTQAGQQDLAYEKAKQAAFNSSSGVLSDLSGATNSLGPLGKVALTAAIPGAGLALTGLSAANALANGGSLEDVAKTAGLAYAGSQLGNVVGADYGQAAGQVAGGTATGLLRGQDFGSSLSSAALNAGANQAAGGLMSAANPSTSGVDYSIAPDSSGGLGLKGALAPTDSSNPYDIGVTNAGGLGFNANLSNLDFSNLYGFNTTQGNGQGIQVPTQQGATLGSIGADATSQNNPATQNLLGKLLLAGITGNTTGTTNMATNNNLLGQLLGSGLTSAGGLMQGSTTAAAQQAQADALRQAGQLASQQAQFRPVGTTTTFGTSNFQVDPTTGQLTSAGYTLSPQLQAYQNQIMGAGQQSLSDAATLQNLGRGYLAQSPQQAAQQWMTNQQALLQPGRDVESARLANQLQQTGRTGVSVAQGGALGAANPEQQALANARAMQDLQLAAQAQQQGQAQTTFGQGLLSSAYQPFNAGLTTASNVEQLGQQPLGLSSGLAQQSSAAGAKAGQLQLGANQAASQAQLNSANYNPWASALSGLGGSSLFGNALGNVVGNTGIGSAIGSWLGSLNPSFSDSTGWSNGGNGQVTLPNGTNINLSDYFNNNNIDSSQANTDYTYDAFGTPILKN